MPPDPAPPRPHASSPSAPTAAPTLLRRPHPAPRPNSSAPQTQSPSFFSQSSPLPRSDPDPLWRESPPPPPSPRSRLHDPLDDFIVPPTPDPDTRPPSYAEVVRRGRPTSPSSPPTQQPRRHLRSAITVPQRSSYYAAQRSNHRSTGCFIARHDGSLRGRSAHAIPPHRASSPSGGRRSNRDKPLTTRRQLSCIQEGRLPICVTSLRRTSLSQDGPRCERAARRRGPSIRRQLNYIQGSRPPACVTFPQ
ncbi:unnamed protein product [Urochloa humidicola]